MQLIKFHIENISMPFNVFKQVFNVKKYHKRKPFIVTYIVRLCVKSTYQMNFYNYYSFNNNIPFNFTKTFFVFIIKKKIK